MDIAIYPRKGTETVTVNTRLDGNVIAIYPRKGTETFLHMYGKQHMSYCNLYPVRGRKHHSSHSGHNSTDGIAIHPRKGTETPLHR